MPTPDVPYGTYDEQGYRLADQGRAYPQDPQTSLEWYRHAVDKVAAQDSPDEQSVRDLESAYGHLISLPDATGERNAFRARDLDNLSRARAAATSGDTASAGEALTTVAGNHKWSPRSSAAERLVNDYEQAINAKTSAKTLQEMDAAHARAGDLLDRMNIHPDIGVQAHSRMADAWASSWPGGKETPEDRRTARTRALTAIRAGRAEAAGDSVRLGDESQQFLDRYTYQLGRIADRKGDTRQDTHQMILDAQAMKDQASSDGLLNAAGRLNANTMLHSALDGDMDEVNRELEYARRATGPLGDMGDPNPHIDPGQPAEAELRLVDQLARDTAAGQVPEPGSAEEESGTDRPGDMGQFDQLTDGDLDELSIDGSTAGSVVYDPQTGLMNVYDVDGGVVEGDYAVSNIRDAQAVLANEGFDLVYDLADEDGDGTLSAQVTENPGRHETGWGRVKANKTHAFRRDPETGAWSSRSRKAGADGEWSAVAGLPPSARNIAPSTVASEIGGVCLACGRSLNNKPATGYGPDCVKKYT